MLKKYLHIINFYLKKFENHLVMKFLATILFFIIVLSNIINGLNNSDIEVCLSYLRNSALRAHNNYRVKHSSPALNLDNNINNIALNYANKLIAVV